MRLRTLIFFKRDRRTIQLRYNARREYNILSRIICRAENKDCLAAVAKKRVELDAIVGIAPDIFKYIVPFSTRLQGLSDGSEAFNSTVRSIMEGPMQPVVFGVSVSPWFQNVSNSEEALSKCYLNDACVRKLPCLWLV